MNCKYCNKDIHKRQIGKHEKSCFMNPINLKYCPVCGKIIKNKNNKTCSWKCSNNFYSYKREVLGIKKAKCIKCNKIFNINKQRSIKNFICDDCQYSIYYCRVCNKKIKSKVKRTHCSRECVYKDPILKKKIDKGLKKGLKKSLQMQNRRSKNEIEFANYCEEVFLNVLTNEPIFNGWDADIILQDQKIAILWNGPWHYTKLFKGHHLNQIQNRDRLKLKEIKKYGYAPYIIKDVNNYKNDFVLKEFLKFIEYLDS